MKIIILSCLVYLSLATVAQTGSTPFKMPAEIKFARNIVQKITGDDKSREMNYYFSESGDYAAIKPEEKGNSSLIIYTKEGNMLMVNDKEKTIIVMNMGKFMGEAAKIGKEMAEKRKDQYNQKDSGDT
ncbi:MAG: hypothetical protein ABUT20_18840 [Bacteroidota bacterium]